MILYKSGLENCVSDIENCCKSVKISKLTTYGLGGYANKCYFPKTPFQAKSIYSSLKAKGSGVSILGNGSNVLACDDDIEEPIICLRNMRGIVRLNKDRILCLAGTTVAEILNYCKKHNLSGIEYMYNIPASIGGAAYMNAGVSGYSISNNIVNIEYFGDFCGRFSKKWCNFNYKHSTMRDINGIILSVVLQLTPSTSTEIDSAVTYFKNKRSFQPKGKSCGCVFKNGEKYSAGELIDKAGLKGKRLGGAFVSCEHANFIINDGGSAEDVKGLISLVKECVFQRFGIKLREEVVYIGEFK